MLMTNQRKCWCMFNQRWTWLINTHIYAFQMAGLEKYRSGWRNVKMVFYNYRKPITALENLVLQGELVLVVIWFHCSFIIFEFKTDAAA